MHNQISTERLNQIDLIRGIALLGLPFMNIINFSMPMSAYWNPTAYGNDDFLNHPLYIFFHLFADQKFMGLFSLLFGASIILLSEKLEATNRKPALIHYSRSFWLLIIGLCHYCFLWEGDILMVYAVIGMLLYPFKNLRAYWLILLGLLVLALSAYIGSINDINPNNLGKEGWQQITMLYNPSLQQIEESKTLYLGSYSHIINATLSIEDTETSADILLFIFLLSIILKSLAMMFFGMALFKIGVLKERFSNSFYKKLFLFSFLVGLPLIILGLYWNYSNQWNAEVFFNRGLWPNTIGSTAVAIAYIGLITLWHQKLIFNSLKRKVQAVGKMALTNYLIQSIICALIFYGYGLGWYGSLSRLQLLPVIAAIIIFQLYFSSLWLTKFTQGPFEWVWRLLTYFKWQNPLR